MHLGLTVEYCEGLTTLKRDFYVPNIAEDFFKSWVNAQKEVTCFKTTISEVITHHEFYADDWFSGGEDVEVYKSLLWLSPAIKDKEGLIELFNDLKTTPEKFSEENNIERVETRYLCEVTYPSVFPDEPPGRSRKVLKIPEVFYFIKSCLMNRCDYGIKELDAVIYKNGVENLKHTSFNWFYPSLEEFHKYRDALKDE
jgi:hypothetical protein